MTEERPLSSGDAPSLRGVALLLALAAALAAILAAHSTMLSAAAGDAWQRTLRVELQRTAALLIDVRQVYGVEGDAGLMIRQEEFLAEALRAASASAEPEVAAVLLDQAQIHADVAAFMAPNVVLAAEEYRLPDGGLDVEGRLADLRAEVPDMVALDPDAHAQSGDRALARARDTMTAALPLGVAFLAGALAMPLVGRRRLLLFLGWGALAAAAVAAIFIEVGT